MPQTNEMLQGLFEATDVPADKQAEFVSIFEAAVAVEAKTVAERVYEAVVADAEEEKAQLQEKMNEYSEYLVEEYATKLDQYLDYATEKLFEDNKMAITNGVKAAMFDSMIGGIKTLVAEHNVQLDDDQVDVVAELEESVAEKSQELNTAIHENMELKSTLNNMKKAIAVQEACGDLAKTQVEKVIVLAKEIPYDSSFERKLQTIVESVSTKPTHVSKDDPARLEFLPEGQQRKKTGLKDLCNL